MMLSASQHVAGPKLVLALVSCATALVLIVFTVPLTTLPHTAAALAMGPGAQAWFMSAMPLGAAAGLLVAGVLGDKHGRRPVFLTGLLIMAAASIGGALAGSALHLIVARVVQGLGGAAAMACGLGIIGQAFPLPRARANATTIWAAGLGAGVAIGPILAATLTESAGWPAPYWCDAVLGIALYLGGRLLPRDGHRHSARVDWIGAVLLMAGLILVLSGLTEIKMGWDRPNIWLLLACGIALLVAFYLVEAKHPAPLLDPSLFKGMEFTAATFAAFSSGAGILALMSLVPMFVGTLLSMDALHAAFLLCAWSATSVLAALGARWIPQTLSVRLILVGGLIACTISQLMLLMLPSDGAMARIIGALLLAGIANGVLNAALGRQAIATVPIDRAAMGSGINNTARYLGSAIGITAGAVLMGHGLQTSGLAGLATGWDEAVLITAAFSIAGAVVVALARD